MPVLTNAEKAAYDAQVTNNTGTSSGTNTGDVDISLMVESDVTGITGASAIDNVINISKPDYEDTIPAASTLYNIEEISTPVYADVSATYKFIKPENILASGSLVLDPTYLYVTAIKLPAGVPIVSLNIYLDAGVDTSTIKMGLCYVGDNLDIGVSVAETSAIATGTAQAAAVVSGAINYTSKSGGYYYAWLSADAAITVTDIGEASGMFSLSKAEGNNYPGMISSEGVVSPPDFPTLPVTLDLIGSTGIPYITAGY